MSLGSSVTQLFSQPDMLSEFKKIGKPHMADVQTKT